MTAVDHRRQVAVGDSDAEVNYVAQLRILGLAGSLRRASYNRGLIRAAVEVAPPGVATGVLDLGAIPLYNQDVEDAGEPASVVAFKGAIAAADALLVATPEYNHGLPGVLKNAGRGDSRGGRVAARGAPGLDHPALGARPGGMSARLSTPAVS
jgi:chromate reductase